jgi:hypothetical protein
MKYFSACAPSRPWNGAPQLRQVTCRFIVFGSASTRTSLYFALQFGQSKRDTSGLSVRSLRSPRYCGPQSSEWSRNRQLRPWHWRVETPHCKRQTGLCRSHPIASPSNYRSHVAPIWCCCRTKLGRCSRRRYRRARLSGTTGTNKVRQSRTATT